MDANPAAQFLISDFKFDDLDALVQLEARLFGTDAFSMGDFLRILRAPRCILWVAWSGTALAGYVAAHAVKDVGYIASIAVDVPFQRRGLGRRLLEGVHQQFRAWGASTMKLHVRVANIPALALYRKLGYTVERRIPDYYVDGSAAYLMRATLYK